MFYFAKVLQALGMGILGIGLLIGMQQQDTTSELKMLAAGGVVFFIGWVVEKRRETTQK